VTSLIANLPRIDFYTWAERYFCLDPDVPMTFEGHEYLREIYQNHHPYTVIEKASQMGISTFAAAKCLWASENLGLITLYYFPTDTDVRDFSQGRVKPWIINSPHIFGVVGKGEADNIGLRKVGDGMLYFRGMKSNIRIKSVAGDFLVFDELDEVPEKMKEAALKRVDHSDFKWVLEISTPSIPQYGIDVEFLRSDQRYWQPKCPHCGEWNCLEETFPECLIRDRDGKAFIACSKCRGELDSQAGQWVSKYPEAKERRGYHICQLYSSMINLNDVLRAWESGKFLDVFYNHKLGMPYVSAKNRLTIQQVEACCRDYEMELKGDGFFMGVDQGDKLHVVISQLAENIRKHVFLDVIGSFEELDGIMNRFNIRCCVIDALPNQHSARSFAARFKGRVFMNFYSEHQKGSANWNEEQQTVTVNRTEAIDDVFGDIITQKIQLPKVGLPESQQFCRHWHNLVKKEEENPDDGTKKWAWVRVGDDHFAHADAYNKIATNKNAGEVALWVF